MSKIAVVTDSDASLMPEMADQKGILQVPINVQFGEETLETWVDINDAQLFERIDKEGKLPTTSAPSPGKFSEAYQKAFDSGAESVLCFCVSSKVSATYGAALAAVEMHPGKDITVIDTLNLSMGQGFMALAAAEAVQDGATKEEAIAHAKDVGERSHFFAALATLKYLAMSGRVGQLTAGMANILNIRPILTITDGELKMLERVRTRRKAWARVVQLVEETTGGQPVDRMAIIHTNAIENAHAFEKVLRAGTACPDEIMISELTAGLSVHGGAGMVGVGFIVGK